MQLISEHREAHFLLPVRSRRRRRRLLLPLSGRQPVVLVRLERVGGLDGGRVEVRREYRTARTVVVVVVVRAEACRRQRRLNAGRRQVTAAATLRLVSPQYNRQTRRPVA